MKNIMGLGVGLHSILICRKEQSTWRVKEQENQNIKIFRVFWSSPPFCHPKYSPLGNLIFIWAVNKHLTNSPGTFKNSYSWLEEKALNYYYYFISSPEIKRINQHHLAHPHSSGESGECILTYWSHVLEGKTNHASNFLKKFNFSWMWIIFRR